MHTWRQRSLLSTSREDCIEYKGTRRAHSVNGKGDSGNGGDDEDEDVESYDGSNNVDDEDDRTLKGQPG